MNWLDALTKEEREFIARGLCSTHLAGRLTSPEDIERHKCGCLELYRIHNLMPCNKCASIFEKLAL